MSRKIHIGYIVLRMDVGGVERSITRLLDGLPKDRYRMTVICLDRSGKAMEWVENKEVQVVELQKSPGWDFRAIRKLAEVIQSQQIDIIQSHNWERFLKASGRIEAALQSIFMPSGARF